MKTLKTLFALGAVTGSVILSGAAHAQLAASTGEVPDNMVACFYECRNGTDPSWWQEVTTLMMVKSGSDNTPLRLWFLDGQSQFIALSQLQSSTRDVDELNVCRTLQAAGIIPPATGQVLMLTLDDADLPYAWVKDHVGKFFKTMDEPFAGRVTSVGKTQCRVVPSDAGSRLLTDFAGVAASPPTVVPVLVGGTADNP